MINVDGVLNFSRLIEPLPYCVLDNGHDRGFQQAHPILQTFCFFSLTSLSLDQHWFRLDIMSICGLLRWLERHPHERIIWSQ
jgi:hypothetical protein